VVIEVKGAWNRGLMTEQGDQLAHRYLSEVQTSHGIYIVGWYPLELWTYSEGRERARYRDASRVNLPELKEQLASQAVDNYRDLGKHARPFILSVPRPRSHDMDESFGTG
jgi:hypothetical protein